MTREFYKEKIEALKKREFKNLTDALFETVYLFAMYGTEKFAADDDVRIDFAILAARYACEIERRIKEGEKAIEKLKNLSKDEEEGLK